LPIDVFEPVFLAVGIGLVPCPEGNQAASRALKSKDKGNRGPETPEVSGPFFCWGKSAVSG
jgi:hypothetical protein